jgi:hypothetical protein
MWDQNIYDHRQYSAHKLTLELYFRTLLFTKIHYNFIATSYVHVIVKVWVQSWKRPSTAGERKPVLLLLLTQKITWEFCDGITSTVSLNCFSDIILRLAVPAIRKFVILLQNFLWVSIDFHCTIVFDGCHLKICTGAVPKTFHIEYLCVCASRAGIIPWKLLLSRLRYRPLIVNFIRDGKLLSLFPKVQAHRSTKNTRFSHTVCN